nr:hypothetical protein KitaXyl93_20490 [Kitasatospora sp. Xyl93]
MNQQSQPSYQSALDAVHTHCDVCDKCHTARRSGAWTTVACSTGRRLRRAALAAWRNKP